MRDGLTGLYNRRAFDEHLKQAIGREGRQEGGRFALLLIDIDHFKKLNDTFGHPAGDAALRHTATLLHGHLRTADQDARFGGEEFAVIVAGADEAGALHLAERVRHGIEKGQLIFDGARLAVTVSIGVAVWPRDGASGPELRRRRRPRAVRGQAGGAQPRDGRGRGGSRSRRGRLNRRVAAPRRSLCSATSGSGH